MTARRQKTPRISARALMAHDLHELGFNTTCAPVLDVPVPGADNIIGDRAYAEETEAVIELGGAVAEGLLAGGILPVMKHIPGHGRAMADSHLALPVVDTPLPELEAHDFAPFRALRHLPDGDDGACRLLRRRPIRACDGIREGDPGGDPRRYRLRRASHVRRSQHARPFRHACGARPRQLSRRVAILRCIATATWKRWRPWLAVAPYLEGMALQRFEAALAQLQGAASL